MTDKPSPSVGKVLNEREADEGYILPPWGEGGFRMRNLRKTDEVLEREADSLPYGSPLPKPEFAKGSEEEIPQGCFSLREKSAISGWQNQFRISNSEFRI